MVALISPQSAPPTNAGRSLRPPVLRLVSPSETSFEDIETELVKYRPDHRLRLIPNRQFDVDPRPSVDLAVVGSADRRQPDDVGAQLVLVAVASAVVIFGFLFGLNLVQGSPTEATDLPAPLLGDVAQVESVVAGSVAQSAAVVSD